MTTQTRRRRGLRVFAAFIASASAAATLVLAQRAQAPAWSGQVDRVFQQWDTRTSPGCALGVFEHGRVTYERGYGMADLEHDVPITPGSVFYVGSLTKQFTAMAAALAIQQGTLGYGDSIRKYLPEMPAYADAIKVSNLIHHTSGLRDYYALLTIAGRRYDTLYDNNAVLAFAARQTKLNFAPGDEYSYSNTGYQLLAVAIQRATGTPFAEYGDQQIFKPLGMTVTHFHTDATRLVKDRVIGYSGTAGTWTLDVPDNERAGAGGLYTNIPDLQRWDENFYTARVGGPEVITRLQTPAHLNDGKAIAYAWGLEIGTYRGLPIVEHGGSLHGYRAELIRFPSQHTSVAILCNHSGIAPSELARRVADVVLQTEFREPAGGGRGSGDAAGQGDHSSPWPEELSAWVGDYYSDELQSTFVITANGRELLLRRDTDAAPRALTMLSRDHARAPGFTISFIHGTSGTGGDAPVTGFVVSAGRVRDVEFVRRP